MSQNKPNKQSKQNTQNAQNKFVKSVKSAMPARPGKNNRAKMPPKNRPYSLVQNEDVNHTTDHQLIIFCLDVSLSMYGDRINQLNKALSEAFFDRLKADETLPYSANISIVTFADAPEVVRKFSLLCQDDQCPEIKVNMESKLTYMGSALSLCVEMLLDERAFYSYVGKKIGRPLLVLITDGKENAYKSDRDLLAETEQKIDELRKLKKLDCIAYSVGNETDMEFLNRITGGQTYTSNDIDFSQFFEHCSHSVEAVADMSEESYERKRKLHERKSEELREDVSVASEYFKSSKH